MLSLVLWATIGHILCYASSQELIGRTAAEASCSSSSSSTSSPDFGSCNDPGIKYGYGLDGSDRYGYTPSNQDQFPHAWSADVASVESFICSRLARSCGADSNAVAVCQSAFDLFSGFEGDQAVEAWNVALGVDDFCDQGTGSSDLTITTITLTAETVNSVVSLPLITATTTTKTTETFTSIDSTLSSGPVATPTSTLKITLTYPVASSITKSSTSLVTSTNSAIVTHTIATTTRASATSTGNSNLSGNGSPFDQNAAQALRLDIPRLVMLIFAGIMWWLNPI